MEHKLAEIHKWMMEKGATATEDNEAKRQSLEKMENTLAEISKHMEEGSSAMTQAVECQKKSDVRESQLQRLVEECNKPQTYKDMIMPRRK